MRLLYSVILLLCYWPGQSLALEFALYGASQYRYSSQSDEPHSFELGDFALLSSQKLSQSATVDLEIVFTDSEQDSGLSIDRLSISKPVHDWASIRLGRFHTPIGFWNQNYHHGVFIQDTVTRPAFLNYENNDENDGAAILPTHMTGLQVFGELKDWSYQLAIANSNGLNTEGLAADNKAPTLQTLNNKDPSDEKSFALHAAYLSDNKWFNEVGVSFLANNVTELGNYDPDNPETSAMMQSGEILFNQYLFGLDLLVKQNKWYLLAELYQIDIEDLIDKQQTKNSALAFYIQYAYKPTDKLTYVARVEQIDYDDATRFFELLGVAAETRTVLAVNYRHQASNGFHFEINHGDHKDSDTQFLAQWYFALL